MTPLSPPGPLSNEDLVDTIIERLRPALNADGGDIEILGIKDGIVRVKLTGACAGCPSAEMTLRLGIEAAVRRARPGLRVVAEPAMEAMR